MAAIRLPPGTILAGKAMAHTATDDGPFLVPQAGRPFTKAGDSYTPVDDDLVVEVVAGTTRHAVVTVVRLR